MNSYVIFGTVLFVFLISLAGVLLHSHLSLSPDAQETLDWVVKMSLGALLSHLAYQRIHPSGDSGIGRPNS